MLLSIVHPYTYKLNGIELVVGPWEKHTERDKKVSDFVQTAFDNNVEVLHYARLDLERPMGPLLQKVALVSDPLYSFLQDERMSEVVTTGFAQIMPEKRLDEIPEKDWTDLCGVYSTWSDFRNKIKEPNPAIFIGGVLEYCVANAAFDFQKQSWGNNQQTFYVPELCVSMPHEDWETAKVKLEERNIRPLDYEEALSLLQTSASNYSYK